MNRVGDDATAGRRAGAREERGETAAGSATADGPRDGCGRYPAGAGGYQQIINQIVPHRVFIAPFLGRCAVLRHLRPAWLAVGVDRDPAVLAWWRHRPAPPGAARLFVQEDSVRWLEQYRAVGHEFVYCNPPALEPSRAAGRAKSGGKMTAVDHERLLHALRKLACPVALTGYPSALYADLLADWRHVCCAIQTRGSEPVMAHLWMNYPPPRALHDYGCLGADYRERERIKRNLERWRTNLAALPRLEQMAIWSALREVIEGAS